MNLKKLADLAAVEGFTITSEAVVRHPAETLVAIAESRKADLIVMARLGFVSEHVLRFAHCPILTVC
jgi:nucleotide-binding universal stress UspA family protein